MVCTALIINDSWSIINDRRSFVKCALSKFDCALCWEDEADTLKAYDATLFKGTPQKLPEVYRTTSPITYAERVIAPIFIIQGRNDTRCPPRQVEVYEAKMKAPGKDIKVHWFDAGHISMDTERQILDQELFMRFAYRVLGL
ncbi:MAG: alpha/beta hydrolase family protein [Ktedonobacteraceae bacterium]